MGRFTGPLHRFPRHADRFAERALDGEEAGAGPGDGPGRLCRLTACPPAWHSCLRRAELRAAKERGMTTAAWRGEFEAFAREVAEKGEIPGMAVAVARDGEVIYAGGFGHRDGDGTVPAAPHTVFGIGSVTKSFTALAVMQLVDTGRLSVDDPVTRWLPEFRLPRPRPGDGPITVHHLLTHTSGMPPEPALLHARAPSMLRDPDLDRIVNLDLPPDFGTITCISTVEELLALLAAKDFDLLGPPGRYFSYSNEGYALLQGIVERAAGQAFVEYLRAAVWAPLGMTRTAPQAEALARFAEVATPHARRREGDRDIVFASPAWHDIGNIVGNGGLASTVQDLLRYLEVYRAGGAGVVSAAAGARMTAPHVAVPTGGFYGYGLRVHPDYHGVRVVEHGGANKGIAAHVAVVPEHGITVAVLTNLTGAPAARVAMGAVNTLLGLPPDTRPVAYGAYACPPERLARFAGTYAAERQRVRFFMDGAALKAELQGRVVEVVPYAEDAVLCGPEMPARFLFAETGDVWAVSLGLRILPRVPA
jgi:CubicO group peptidase (beta-lactamase class C family)